MHFQFNGLCDCFEDRKICSVHALHERTEGEWFSVEYLSGITGEQH